MDRDEMIRLVGERVEQGRADSLKLEQEWPTEIKEAVAEELDNLCSLLDQNKEHDLPLVERAAEVRGKLTLLLSAISGASIIEILSMELKTAQMAEVVNMMERFGVDNRN